MKEILIATYPFGQCGEKPVKTLEGTGYRLRYNSLGRRLREDDMVDIIGDAYGVIAGTEPYTRDIIEKAPNLQVISRVGVGLDSVDFYACQDNNITVTFTPEAPSDGVADLAVAQIINLLRGVFESDKSVRDGTWSRYMGMLIREVNVGILGVGRIGGRVVKRLRGFNPKNILCCDLNPQKDIKNITWLDKKDLFEQSDILTIHIPMNKRNYHCVGFDEISSFKKGSFLINTSRGPVIDEKALCSFLCNGYLAGAALDVFEKEPPSGNILESKNTILTAHIGSSTYGSRYGMELGAAIDCAKVLMGEQPDNSVTEKDIL